MNTDPKVIDIDEAVEILKRTGYDDHQLDTLRGLHAADKQILVFENHDLGHPAVGHRFAMVWDEGERGDIPPHGPDTEATGLGWRYRTAFVIPPNPSSIQEV